MINLFRSAVFGIYLVISTWMPCAKAVTVYEDDLIVLEGNSYTIPAGAVVQPDGKFILGGATQLDGAIQVIVAKYLPSGKPDPSFGRNGYTLTRLPNGGPWAYSLELDSAGKIYIGGTAVYGNKRGSQFFLIRYLANGELDMNFNGNGIRLADGGDAHALKIQSDGKIILVGNSKPGWFSHIQLTRFFSGFVFSLIRINPDGSKDLGFGDSGSVLTSVGSVSEDHADAVALQEDGKILVAGYSHTQGNGDFTVLRYKNNGRLDKSFANKGILVVQMNSPLASRATSLIVQKDGYIVVGGSLETAPSYRKSEFVIARLTPSGSFDNSFGGQGAVRPMPGISTGISISGISSIVLQNDGKIIAVGHFIISDNKTGLALARFLPNGQPDLSFGSNGSVQFEMVEATITPKNIKLLNNEEILVSGMINYPAALYQQGKGSLFLMRLTRDGRLISRRCW